MKKPDSITLLLDSARGVYIPQNFAQGFDLEKWHVDQEDADILAQGPEHEWYWEAWDSVLNKAHYEHEGYTYRLYQHGDLWACCYELMSDEEYENFCGEKRD